MKLSFIFFIVVVFSISASSYSQTQRLTIDKNNVTIAEVFKDIEANSEFSFLYSPRELNVNERVSVSGNNLLISDILSLMLSGKEIAYRITDKHIILYKTDSSVSKAELTKQQGVTITGTVTDVAGEPMPGVNVVIKGTTNGVVSDLDGKFTIKVPNEEAILLFSFIGYVTKEVIARGQQTLNITMDEEARQLDEIVVVGYGSQSRRFLTTSVSSVKQEDLNKGAISDVGQMLQGKVPGLNVTKSGDPNRAAAVILRGASTLRDGAQSPLYVIDGVPGADISIIAPDDIVTLDVLKDAAATAIYGNRAANGVIMVTTKRGKTGQVQLTYNGYMAIESVSNRYDMMSGDQLRNYLSVNGQSLAPKDDVAGASTNWQDELQRTGLSQNHNLSLGGGTDKMNYSASVNYFDQQGIIKNSGLQRVIARLSVQQKAFNDHLEMGITATNSISDADLIPFRNVVFSQMLSYLPTVPVHNADGGYYENFDHTSYYNPVSMNENAEENQKYKNFLGTFTAKVKLPWGFTYNLSFSYQDYQTLYNAYYNKYYTDNYNAIRTVPEPGGFSAENGILTGKDGVAIRNTYRDTNIIFETYLNWDKTFGDHAINAVAGYSYQNTLNGAGFQASSTLFPTDDAKYNNLSLGDPYGIPSYRIDLGWDRYQPMLLISDFARINYNYKGRYLLQASLRHDGSNVFGDNYQWGLFPSVGVAWRIIQEGFMQNQSILSDLKLRVGYGETGNSLGFNTYSAQLLYGKAGTFIYNGQLMNAYGATQNSNPNLRWEKTSTGNIGVDFAVLNGRLGGSIEVYEKRTSDLIYNYDVSTSVYPYPTIVANVGEMSNKGIEIALNATPVQSKDFNWQTNLNFAHNKNKIVSLSNDQFQRDNIPLVEPVGGGQSGVTVQILESGKPIGQYFTFRYAGKNEDGVSQYYDHEGNVTADMSKLKNIEDYYYAGDAQPKALLGWSNNFKYKNVDFNFFLRSVVGVKVFNITLANLYRPNSARLNNIPVEVESESVNDYNSFRYSDRFIEDASYLRLDNATLGYSFNNITKDIKKIRLYVSANNLFVITSYKGIDPEVNQGGMAPGVDANNFYPKTRTILFGVNASF